LAERRVLGGVEALYYRLDREEFLARRGGPTDRVE
jgi:hypothetical protein